MGKITAALITIFICCILSVSVYANGFVKAGPVFDSSQDVSTSLFTYKDASPNDDIGLALCINDNTKFVGAVYGANVSGVFTYGLISYDTKSGSNTLSPLVNDGTVSLSAGCYYSDFDAVTFPSGSNLAKSIPVYKPAFPGNLFLIYADDTDGLNPNFVLIDPVEGSLSGSYGGTSIIFNQSSMDVSFDFSSIIYGGVGSKSISDPDYGFDNIANDKVAVLSICDDAYGASCSDATIINDTAQLPAVLSSGLMAINDLNSYDKFAVINGIGEAFCIGPDLRITNIDTNGPIYAGQETTIDITIENSGNVDVNTDFEISLNQTDADAVETIVLPASFSQIAYDDFENDFGHWANNENITNGGACFIENAWGKMVTTTSSEPTGPQSGGVGGAGTNFIYVETSSNVDGCYSQDQALVYFNESIDHDLFDARIEFYFHSYGADIDSLYLEENSTGSWMSVWEIHDINNDYWNKTVVELSSLSGVGSLRFNYTRNSSGWLSDIALDQINVSVRESSKITTSLPPSSSTTISVNVTPDTGTGLYEYDAGLILDSIADCDEGNNADLRTLTVENVYSAIINIDGQETVHFDEAARPHNFSIQIVDADGFQPPNITVIVSETNGLNIMAPLQWYEGDTRSLGSISQARFLTNGTGYAAVSLVPTGDKVYTNLIDSGLNNSFIGNYSLTLELFDQDGNQLPVLHDGVIYQSLPMYVDDNNYPEFYHGLPPGGQSTFNNNIYLQNNKEYLQKVWGWLNQFLEP